MKARSFLISKPGVEAQAALANYPGNSKFLLWKCGPWPVAALADPGAQYQLHWTASEV